MHILKGIFFLLIGLKCFHVYAQQPKFLTLKQEIEMFEDSLNESPENIKVLEKLIGFYNLNSDYIKSEKTIQKFQRKLNTKKKKIYQGDIFLLLAITYKYQFLYDKSALYFLKAKEFFLENKDYYKLTNLGGEYVEFYRKQSHYPEAHKMFFNYIYLTKIHEIKDPRILNKLYNRYAAVLNEDLNVPLSVKYSLKAIKQAEKINDPNLLAISYNELGYSHRNFGNWDIAADYYLKAEEQWKKVGYLRDATHAKMNRILLLSHANIMPLDQQLKETLEVLEYIDKNKIDYPKVQIYSNIKNYYIVKKNYKKALEYEYLLTSERIKEVKERTQTEVTNIQEKYENEKLIKVNKSISSKAKQKQLDLKNARNRIIIIISILLIVFIALATVVFLWIKLRVLNKKLVLKDKQKTILVQEIHHRVKNNLQFMKSMLEMQIGVSSHESKSLEDVYRRVDAMSLVHEMLYIDDANMNLSIKDYLEKLIDFSNILYNKDQKITFNLKCVDVELPIDKIVSIGIICSELLSNSLKYAFVDQERPIISFELTQNEENYTVNYSDNGVGLVEKESDTRKTLGMRLIDIFSRQLNGEYSIHSTKGFNFVLNFKK